MDVDASGPLEFFDLIHFMVLFGLCRQNPDFRCFVILGEKCIVS